MGNIKNELNELEMKDRNKINSHEKFNAEPVSSMNQFQSQTTAA